MSKTWIKTASRNITNLHVLKVDGREVGFIEKPTDRDGDRNSWRAYRGVPGEFIGHSSTKQGAQKLVERASDLVV